MKSKAGMFIAGVVVVFFSLCVHAATEEVAEPTQREAQKEMIKQAQQELEGQPAAAETVPTFKVSRITLEGSNVLTADELFANLPGAYKPEGAEEPYDFTKISALWRTPDQEQEISARDVQGLTQYLLGVYQKKGFAGIYVYVPAESFAPGGALDEGILTINVIEAKISQVDIGYRDPNGLSKESSYLQPGYVERWSPVEQGKVANRKKLDEFVNLLNLNPDRYVSAVVSQGKEKDTLDVAYDIYEANPWHIFAQVDNSGTKERRWNPRFGLIHTNLLGFDDKLTVLYQTPLDSGWDENYSVYGSYDFPLLGPKLRLNLFAGYSEYDVQSTGDVSFLGRGKFYGGQLRYNLFQTQGWFFDLTGSLSRETSKSTPSLFPDVFTSDVTMDLLEFGVEASRVKDRSETSISLKRVENIGGSGHVAFNQTRILGGAQNEFTIYTLQARHSQYLDKDKIHRLTGRVELTDTDDRLPPAKMTSFGGMYSVRGYDEYEIVADTGVLASLQYEFDLVQYDRALMRTESPEMQPQTKPLLRKLAPALFLDYGQARIQHAQVGEQTDRELFSWGGGCIVEIGEHLTGVVYYGYPLIPTESTHTGKGRVNAGFMVRW